MGQLSLLLMMAMNKGKEEILRERERECLFSLHNYKFTIFRRRNPCMEAKIKRGKGKKRESTCTQLEHPTPSSIQGLIFVHLSIPYGSRTYLQLTAPPLSLTIPSFVLLLRNCPTLTHPPKTSTLQPLFFWTFLFLVCKLMVSYLKFRSDLIQECTDSFILSKI